MQITVKVHRSGSGLQAQGARQLPFAMALAINRTIEEGQAEVRRGVRSRFTVRTPFVDRLVKIRRDDRATKQNLVGRLRIEGPEGEERKAAILSRHEEGGRRELKTGGYSIDPGYRVAGMFFLPTQHTRPSPGASIARRDFPAALRLASRLHGGGETLGAQLHRTATGKLQLKGKRRAFVLFGANGGAPLGIFQRVGPPDRDSVGRDRNIVQLWRYKRSVTLPRRLQFFPTARRVAQQRFAVNLRGFLTHALRTAR